MDVHLNMYVPQASYSQGSYIEVGHIICYTFLSQWTDKAIYKASLAGTLLAMWEVPMKGDGTDGYTSDLAASNRLL